MYRLPHSLCAQAYGHSDPDGLLPAVEIGEILLLRTRYGAGEVLKPDDRTHLISVFDLSTPAMMPGSHQTCLLRTALGGTARAETHLVCIDLNKFVTEHGPLLHGPPDRQPRKVVFDQNSEVFHAQ
jgi:hypothetical protein